jgi:phosphotransferase system enzyme I (PtsI)
MAGDPYLTPVLLGLGIDELSVAPPSLPSIKYLIRRLKMGEAKALAEFALGCENPQEVLERLHAHVREIAPSLLESPSKSPS